MNLPLKFEVLIITLSDRAYKGEYKDLSGPRIGERISEYMSSSDGSLRPLTALSQMIGQFLRNY